MASQLRAHKQNLLGQISGNTSLNSEFFEKGWLPAIAALGDVVGIAGRNDARKTCHKTLLVMT